MSNAKINNEVELTYPDTFREMGEEELSKYFGKPDNRWGVHDGDSHILLSVSWTKPGFFRSMGDAETVIIGAESRLHRSLLNYQRVSSYKLKIEKIKANGIRFEYRSNDSVVVQLCDLIAFKYKKKFYSVYFISRKVDAVESRRALEEIVKSIKLS